MVASSSAVTFSAGFSLPSCSSEIRIFQDAMPAALHAFCFMRTYVAESLRAPTTTTARPTGRPWLFWNASHCGLSCCVRTTSLVALPSSSRGVGEAAVMERILSSVAQIEKKMLLELGRFVFLALTDAAMLPALDVMKRNRRHFELFVGVLQLVVSFCFNAAEAFDTQLFLKEDQWHFLSDVLSVAYFLLLCVHLMGYKDENHNIVLRYVAFAGAWLLKTKDGWDSALYEGLLVVCYILGVIYRRVATQSSNISPLNKQKAAYAVGCLVAATIVGVGAVFFSDDDNHAALGFAKGLMHVMGGAAFYFAWLSVPCLDSKKDDIMPTYSSYL
ncbi:hypothetical protein PRIC1_008678 [Phytophthora ramorum]